MLHAFVLSPLYCDTNRRPVEVELIGFRSLLISEDRPSGFNINTAVGWSLQMFVTVNKQLHDIKRKHQTGLLWTSCVIPIVLCVRVHACVHVCLSARNKAMVKENHTKPYLQFAASHMGGTAVKCGGKRRMHITLNTRSPPWNVAAAPWCLFSAGTTEGKMDGANSFEILKENRCDWK